MFLNREIQSFTFHFPLASLQRWKVYQLLRNEKRGSWSGVPIGTSQERTRWTKEACWNSKKTTKKINGKSRPIVFKLFFCDTSNSVSWFVMGFMNPIWVWYAKSIRFLYISNHVGHYMELQLTPVDVSLVFIYLHRQALGRRQIKAKGNFDFKMFRFAF